MVAPATAFGIRPVSSPTGTERLKTLPLGIADAYASVIPHNHPIVISAGLVVKAPDGTAFDGILDGVDVDNDSPGSCLTLPYWPANTQASTQRDIKVFPVDNQEFEIMCDSSVSQAEGLGKYAIFTIPATYNSGYPFYTSLVYLAKASLGATATDPLKVVGVSQDPQEGGWSKANTILRVVANLPTAFTK